MFSRKIRQKFRGPRVGGLLGNAGQATVETMLVAVLSFLLVSGLFYQFNTGFRNYIDNYYGGYLVCLLETGELPRLGSTADSGVCALTSFELGEEGPRLGDAGGGESAASSASGSSGAANRRPSRSAEGRGGGASGGGGAGSKTFVRSDSASDGSSEAEAQQGAEKKSASVSDGSVSNLPPLRMRRVGSKSAGDKDKITVQSSQSYLEGQLRAEKERPPSAELLPGENENALRASKLSFDPRSLASLEPEEPADMDLGLFDYLRYLIILALIIAIVIFVGGQALQIAKSRDL